ncbi:MAG: MBL fold metallo-hydrolase [Candidatus Paceibacterota bacterium]|jgi:competence protein ComEC
MLKRFSHIRAYLRWYILGLLLILSFVLWSTVIRENRQGILTVVFLNVGQGDSIFIESPTGIQVLIDGGPNNALMKEISSILPWYDRKIDMLVVTNPDKDHYEGFIPFLKKYKTDVVLEPGTTNKSEAYSLLEDEIINKKIPKIIARRGQIIDLGGSAYLRVIFPDRDISGLNPNDGSIVMQLVYGETSVMLQGDSPTNIEHFLVSLENNLKSTILKAGHHGSRTSSSEEYVKAVDPEWVVISAGKNNTYGHPHKEVLDILNKLKVPIIGTYDVGQVIFESDGKRFLLKR